MEQRLTPKQGKFVDGVVEGKNGAEAARSAGYSEKNARNMACENLTKPNIAEAIARSRKEIARDAGITVEKLFREMAGIAFSNIRDLLSIEPDGGLVFREIAEIPESAWPSIKEVNAFQLPDGGGVGVKVILWDKVKALALLGKWLIEENDPETLDGSGKVFHTVITINNPLDNSKKVFVNGEPWEEDDNTSD